MPKLTSLHKQLRGDTKKYIQRKNVRQNTLEENKLIVDGIVKEFTEKEINEKNLLEIIRHWFHEIDKIYYKRDEIEVTLSPTDLKVIKLCHECVDKLKVLSFKKNVKIPNLPSTIHKKAHFA